MGNGFKVDMLKDHRGDTLVFYGNIDSESDQHFDNLLHTVSGDCVFMDFSNVGRINSMGIALLLRSINKIKTVKNVEVCIQGVNQINTILFQITGIFRLASHVPG